jgi:hypothetical protein
MTGPGESAPGQSNHSARIRRMPCLKERQTDSRTYAALPITEVING